ncbi:cholinesterase [Pochonia chlamydosporia 170]|uniref:Carboxylic ester hydrolase n=1 Tax=Pochonia chlamydosporia 170 TaxID=1380566 RepID=A0A179F736_METCM|nr:cholinesterase [Pochonia chlamydosporia 170]OAQ61275.1 cholinesterase [Pochonia chlamydosporia 170]
MKLLPLLPATIGLCAALHVPRLAAGNNVERRDGTVKVSFPGGSVVGKALQGRDSFNGIPFANPPIGTLRLKPPQKLSAKLNDFDGTGVAAECPQMYGKQLDKPIGQEDCLTLNVERPAGTKAGDKLPVLFWIFGGGFTFGASNLYNAENLFATALPQKQPFIFVAVNYRLNGFGFLPGKEILNNGAANLGLLDQRLGLEWVADNIAAFGGDPDKVTIWGESAGSISVFDQMLLFGGNASYNGNPLFRGAIMNSGSVIPVDPVDCPKGQAVYDRTVERGGCQGSTDTLECLRQLPFEKFYNAVVTEPAVLSYNALALSYLPRPDGKILLQSPDDQGLSGKLFAVPTIIGDLEDEGSIFALFQQNLTTPGQVVDYLAERYFTHATKPQLQELLDTYEADPAAGSPFRTGDANQIYPGFKRLAALLGDMVFTLTRRLTLTLASVVKPDMPTWSYLASYKYNTPILGTFHISDVMEIFYNESPNSSVKNCRTYYFNFLYNQDPNVGVTGLSQWPRWADGNKLMWFQENKTDLLADDFRNKSADFLLNNKDILKF